MTKKLFIALILSSVSGFVIATKHHKETQNPSSQKTENPLAHLIAILPDRVIQKLVAGEALPQRWLKDLEESAATFPKEIMKAFREGKGLPEHWRRDLEEVVEWQKVDEIMNALAEANKEKGPRTLPRKGWLSS